MKNASPTSDSPFTGLKRIKSEKNICNGGLNRIPTDTAVFCFPYKTDKNCNIVTNMFKLLFLTKNVYFEHKN